MWTKAFWKGAGERAIKTFFQTLGSVLAVLTGADLVDSGIGLADVGWLGVLSTAALSAILSLATSIGNADFTAGYVEPVEYDRLIS